MLQFGQLFLFYLSCDLIGLVEVLVILLLLIGLFFPFMHLKNDIIMAEVFIIYAPVPFSVQCSPTVFVLSYRVSRDLMSQRPMRFYLAQQRNGSL